MALRGKSGRSTPRKGWLSSRKHERNCYNGIQEYEKSCTGRGNVA